MQITFRTLALSAAFLALTSSAFASSPGGTNPVPPPTTASAPGGTNPVPPPSSSTDFLSYLASLLGL